MAIVDFDGTSIANLLYHEALAGQYDGSWFDASHWEGRGAHLHSTTGRGGVWMLDHGDETWVLRHYHRGGAVANFIYDHYIWLGPERTRSFREWRLLDELFREGFPVAKPIAARAVRRGPFYQADIITRLLPDTRTLSSYLLDGGPEQERWTKIGAMVKSVHDRGVDHPDLTAHNILLDTSGGVFLVDFDNARLKAPGAWQEAGLTRLQRSLRKVAVETGRSFSVDDWQLLESAYRRRS